MDTSRFSYLPLEIRYQIYELAFAQEQHIIVSSRSVCGPTQYEGFASLNKGLNVWTTLRNPLALLQTSAQIRREAMETFLSVNKFAMAISTGPSVGFPSKRTIEENAAQHIGLVDGFLREICRRTCPAENRDNKRVRLHLNFGEISIQTLYFYGEDKMIAAFLCKLQRLMHKYRFTTGLNPRLRISLDFEWHARSMDRLNGENYTKARLPIAIDMDRGYDSLSETLEQWKRELDGAQDTDEPNNELEREQSNESLIVTNGPRPHGGYKKMAPEFTLQIERAMDAMKSWQRVFAAPTED